MLAIRRRLLPLGSLLFPSLAAAAPPERVEFLHHDVFGNLLAVTDETGAVASRMTPQPFADGGSERFVDHLREADGSFQLGARVYDPVLGAFRSPDPQSLTAVDLTNPQRLNRYAYALSNPYRYSDATGTTPISAVADLGTLGTAKIEISENDAKALGPTLTFVLENAREPRFPLNQLTDAEYDIQIELNDNPSLYTSEGNGGGHITCTGKRCNIYLSPERIAANELKEDREMDAALFHELMHAYRDTRTDSPKEKKVLSKDKDEDEVRDATKRYRTFRRGDPPQFVPPSKKEQKAK